MIKTFQKSKSLIQNSKMRDKYEKLFISDFIYIQNMTYSIEVHRLNHSRLITFYVLIYWGINHNTLYKALLFKNSPRGIYIFIIYIYK